jgi:hypothetical protein
LPDLIQSLQGRDLGHLRIIAMLWGLDLSAPDTRVGLQRLVPQLLDREVLIEVIEVLPEEARAALNELLLNDGRLPWAAFARRYGPLREMGAARRDRERPFEKGNASPLEALYYRALVASGFFETSEGPEEFAYIPGDLLELMPPPVPAAKSPLGRPASPAERAFILPAGDWILDDACTLLAALRNGSLEGVESHLIGMQHDSSHPPLPYSLTPQALHGLLAAAGLLDPHGSPLPEPTRAFLEARRGEALALLFRSWLRSTEFNELRLIPSLLLEGEWRNDALHARQAILDFLSTVPGSLAPNGDEAGRPFWSLYAFVTAVRQADPDFQRPGGDYDSWFLRRRTSGEYLRGFESWDAVEGELVRYLVAGPLYWLGLFDLGLLAPEAEVESQPAVAAFRYSQWANDLLSLKPAEGLEEETEKLLVAADGRIKAGLRVPRPARYQVARFAAWEGVHAGIYHYRLTPASLRAARSQGLRVMHLLALLRRQARALPPTLAQALERWEERGSEARLEQVSVLRVKDPALLSALRASRAARFLGEPLGPAAVIVKPGAAEKVLSVLAELGYLGEIEIYKS